MKNFAKNAFGRKPTIALIAAIGTAALVLPGSAAIIPMIPACTYVSANWCQSVSGQFCIPWGNYSSYDQQVWYCSGGTVVHPGNCYTITTTSCCLSSGPNPGCPPPSCPCPVSVSGGS